MALHQPETRHRLRQQLAASKASKASPNCIVIPSFFTVTRHRPFGMRNSGKCLLWLLQTALAAAYLDVLRPAPPLCPLFPSEGVDGAVSYPISEVFFSLNDSLMPDIAPPKEEEAWANGGVCHRLGGNKYCTFTNPSFNGGLGISLITTAEKIDELSSTLAFNAANKEFSGAEPPYRDAVITGKGIGLVATELIKEGQRIMAHTPTVMVDGTVFKRMTKEYLTGLLGQAVEQLPSSHQAQFLNLSTHTDANSHAEKVYKIFATNNFKTVLDGGLTFHSTFTEGKLERCKSMDMHCNRN